MSVARLPSIAMFLGVLMIVLGVMYDPLATPTNDLLISVGIAINQFLLILASSGLGERSKELAASIEETRALSAENGEALAEARGEMRTLREQVMHQAEELARTARGSETRAENAAAEITRVAGEIIAMRQEAEEALTAISLVGRAVHDRLVLLKIENDLRGDLREDAR